MLLRLPSQLMFYGAGVFTQRTSPPIVMRESADDSKVQMRQPSQHHTEEPSATETSRIERSIREQNSRFAELDRKVEELEQQQQTQ